MTETQHPWSFTAAMLVVLLVLTAFGNALLTVGAARAIIAIGFVALPRQRARGALAAVIAAGVATATAASMRWLQ